MDRKLSLICATTLGILAATLAANALAQLECGGIVSVPEGSGAAVCVLSPELVGAGSQVSTVIVIPGRGPGVFMGHDGLYGSIPPEVASVGAGGTVSVGLDALARSLSDGEVEQKFRSQGGAVIMDVGDTRTLFDVWPLEN